MPGTAISLRTTNEQGAVQRSPEHILSITYPTEDILVALRALNVERNGGPIVLLGDRGRGKSHIMAVMHHAIKSPEIVEKWLEDWSQLLCRDELGQIKIAKGYFPISEQVHNHEYPTLWALIFDRHPKGEYYRGQFESLKQPFPPRSLLEKMFSEQPTCLIFDEFQTWYMGLPTNDPDTGINLRQYAFNFVQILSELAKERPEILLFAISTLNSNNEAYSQVHRQGPIIVDFQGPTAKEDRQKLLLHRLFENRRNIHDADIKELCSIYANERFRLLRSGRSEAERSAAVQEVVGSWPFSPELIDRLENHILLSSAAQQTRDMIRILAMLYRSRASSAVPILTPADFFVDCSSDAAIQTLVNTIATEVNQNKLLTIAQNNLSGLHDAGVSVTHAQELISAIWMRSMSPGIRAGGTYKELQLDITRVQAIDDQAFQCEVALLVENSINIHGDDVADGRLRFALEENPRSKVRSFAKNDRLWSVGGDSSAGVNVYPGRDIQHIRNTLRHVFVPETTSPPSRIIVLGPGWRTNPWAEVDEADHPAKWESPVLLVLPEQPNGGAANLHAILGDWLAKNVQRRRNTVRFLLPAVESQGLFSDAELLYTARCSFLCSREAWGSDQMYRALHADFDRTLRNILKTRFNRFAILRKWDYQSAANCQFDVERISEQGSNIPAAVEKKIEVDLFDRSVFRNFVLDRAKESGFVGNLFDELVEPPARNSEEAIPFLGETQIYELLLRFTSEGVLALNVGGNWIKRRAEDTTPEDALRYVRQKGFRSGREAHQVQLGLPANVGGATLPGTPSPPYPPPPPAVVPPTFPPLPTSGSDSTQPADTGGAGKPPLPAQVAEPTGSGGLTSPMLSIQQTPGPATGINLSGCFEGWGVSDSQTLHRTSIYLDDLTVQQLKQLLQRFPSTIRATMSISYYKEPDK